MAHAVVDPAAEIGAISTGLLSFFALSGMHRGIKRISEITMELSVLLTLFELVTGPTAFISSLFFRHLGQYAGPPFTTRLITPSWQEGPPWMQGWT